MDNSRNEAPGKAETRSFGEVVRDSRFQFVLDREGMWKRIGGETVRFWLDGSRRFRFPGISSVQPLICDSCQVFVFSKSVPQKLESLLKAAKDARRGIRHVIRGYSVAEYLPESLRKSPQGFLVVLVRRRLPWIRWPLQGQQQCSDHIYCLANCRNCVIDSTAISIGGIAFVERFLQIVHPPTFLRHHRKKSFAVDSLKHSSILQ